MDHTTRRERERPAECISREYVKWAAMRTLRFMSTSCTLSMLSPADIKHLKGKQLRQLRETKLHALKQALKEEKPVNAISKFLVSLPTCESHEKSHPTGIVSGPAQKVHPLISKKIEDLVREGSTDPNEVQRSLRDYVRNQCSALKPSPVD